VLAAARRFISLAYRNRRLRRSHPTSINLVKAGVGPYQD